MVNGTLGMGAFSGVTPVCGPWRLVLIALYPSPAMLLALGKRAEDGGLFLPRLIGIGEQKQTKPNQTWWRLTWPISLLTSHYHLPGKMLAATPPES